MRSPIQIAVVAALLGTAFLSSTGSAQTSHEIAVEAQAQALQTWHEKIKQMGPPTEGCFHTTYPSVIWEKVTCGPRPTYRSRRVAPRALSSADARSLSEGMSASSNGGAAGAQTVGDGTDYAAQAAGIIKSATGSFPVVSGVTSEKGINVPFDGATSDGIIGANQYTLQLNTDVSSSSAACAKFGYNSCHVWEQFVYATDAYTDGTRPQAFIQSWVYPSINDYNTRGCPTSAGWEDETTPKDGPACVHNSAGASLSQLPISKLASLKLSGAVTSSGSDVVTLTVGTDAYADKVADSTVYAALWWKQAEFNLVGNGGGSQASFNKGSSVKVNLVVNDGGTTAPKCLGPNGVGSTGETNNLTLGNCAATGGSSPAISFTESN